MDDGSIFGELPDFSELPLNTMPDYTAPLPTPDFSSLFPDGNQYLPSGEGNGADGPAGPGGDAPGSTGAQFDWGEYNKDPQGYLAKLLGAAGGLFGGSKGGSSGGGLGDILKMFGLGGAGGSDLSSLLPLLMLAAGTINSSGASKEASQQLQAAAKEANTTATGLMQGAAGNYQPYIDAGKGALADMQAFDKTPLASKFVATGGGVKSDLGSRFVANPARVTLADLAGRK